VDFDPFEYKLNGQQQITIVSMMKVVKSLRREPPNDPKKPPVKPPPEKRPPMQEPPKKKSPIGDRPPKKKIKAKAV
jgi:hypothetical protein